MIYKLLDNEKLVMLAGAALTGLVAFLAAIIVTLIGYFGMTMTDNMNAQSVEITKQAEAISKMNTKLEILTATVRDSGADRWMGVDMMQYHVYLMDYIGSIAEAAGAEKRVIKSPRQIQRERVESIIVR